MICLENSQGGCNGAKIPLKFVKKVKSIARKHKLRMHLDGARLLNALVEDDIEPQEYAKSFDTVSFCLSKGLGCPLGSVLVGSHEDIEEARNLRKMIGGGMRQAGLTASCALVALEDYKDKLALDNSNARLLAKELNSLDGVSCDESSVHTNMFVFATDESPLKPDKDGNKLDHPTLCLKLKEEFGTLTFPWLSSPGVRVVTHRDVNTEDMYTFRDQVKTIMQRHM